MNDFTTTQAGTSFDAALASVQQNWGAALSAPQSQQPQQTALDARTLKAFEDSAVKYNVPVDVLMAMAEKDSGFDATARSRGLGPKTRGIIKMSDSDQAKATGVNPYVQEQNIDYAAGKLRNLIDGGNLSVPDAVKAFAAGGSDPAQWGPDAHSYADDVLSRTKRLKDTYYPPQPEPEPIAPAPEKKQEGSLAGDAYFQLAGGANKGLGSIVHGLGAGVALVGDYTTTPILNKIFGREGNTPNALDPLAESLDKFGKKGESFVSSDTKKAIEESSPGGNLFKPSTWTLGKNPSLRGYTALGLDVFGGMLPIIAASIVSGGGALAGAAVEGAQGAGAASQQAQEAITKMAETPADPNKPDGPKQIETESAYYKQLIAEGKKPEQALNLTRSAAGRMAFIFTLPASVLGGAVMSKILHPASGIASQTALPGRIAGRAAIGGAEEGVQETAEQIGQNVGTNVGAGTSVDPMDDTFGNFILGVLGGMGPGGVAGGLSKRSAGHEPPAAPPAPPAPPEAPPGGPAGPTAPAPTSSPVNSAPVAPTNKGPLSSALEAGAPEAAGLADVLGKRVILTDKVGQMAGHVVGQDADGVMFRGDDGNELLIGHDEISSGKVSLAEAPNAPKMDEAKPLPQSEHHVIEEEQAKDEPAKEEAPKLAAPVKDSSVEEARTAKLERTKPDIFVDDAPKADAEPAKPRNTAQIQREEGISFADALKKSEQEKAAPAPEPAPAAGPRSSLTEEAAAKVKEHVKPQDRSHAEMSSDELRERLTFIRQQAKGANGWNRPLINERAKIESELGRRGESPKDEAPASKDDGAEWWGGLPSDQRSEIVKAAGWPIAGPGFPWSAIKEDARKRLLAQRKDTPKIEVAPTPKGERVAKVLPVDPLSPKAPRSETARRPWPSKSNAEPAGKASVASVASPISGLDAAGLRDHLTGGKDGDIIGKLLESGSVTIHDNHTTLPAGKTQKGRVQGMTTPDGSIHLVARSLNAETARGVLLHEAFHAGAEPLVGSRGWTALMGRVNTAIGKAMDRESAGARHDFWTQALNRASEANVPAHHLAEEVAAYAIENRENSPAGIREAIDRFIGHLKSWALQKFGKQFGDVTQGQLHALARAALRSWKDAPRVNAAENGERYSMATRTQERAATSKTLYAKASDAASDFLTDAMGRNEKFNILKLAPVRPLFLELAKGMPAARDYVATKQAMDAMRHRLNAADAETLDKWSKWVREGFGKKNKAENKELMDLMHESTLAQVDPSKEFESAWSKDDENALQKAKIGSDEFDQLSKAKAEDEARRADHEDMSKRFDALSPTAKALYGEVRDAYQQRADETEKEVIANIQRALDTMQRRARDEHADEMERIKDKGFTGKERQDAIDAADMKLAMTETRVRRNRAARVKRLREQFESNRLKGPYFPLARFGQYFVTVRDDSGRVINFSRFEAAHQQRAFYEEMSKNPDYKVERGALERKDGGTIQPDTKFVSDVDSILEGANAPSELRDQVWQRYLV